MFARFGACYVLVLLVICCLVYVACFLVGYCLFACGLIWYWFLGVELYFVDMLLLLWLLICVPLLVEFVLFSVYGCRYYLRCLRCIVCVLTCSCFARCLFCEFGWL